MITIGVIKVLKTSLDNFGRRIVQALFMGGITNGKGDVRTPLQVAPFGIDSNPTKDKRGLYVTTQTIGKYYTFGYLNTDQMAEPGETRIFSTSTSGQLQAYVWLKSAGNILELNGDDNWAVKFNELKTEFNSLKQTVNTNASVFNAHTHILALSAGTGTAAPSVTQEQSSTANIDNAKNTKIKTNS